MNTQRLHPDRRTRSPAPTARQRGVVLPTIMVLMVIMVVLGIAGMDDTAMQERMSGNLRNRDIAFQAAESSLRAGEAWLQANVAAASANPRITGLAARDWDGAAPAPSGVLPGLYAADPVIDLAADPVFYVGPPELLRINPGETPPEFREIHPVIARAVGATANTLVVLRSTFEPL
jgi:type IV pilus assembly protein PilX